MRVCLLILALTFLNSCSTTEYYVSTGNSPGDSNERFRLLNHDHTECQVKCAQAHGDCGVGGGTFMNQCMLGYGWKLKSSE